VIELRKFMAHHWFMSQIQALTPRQREILAGAQRGETIEKQAVLLGISPHTVRVLRGQIRKRLGTAKQFGRYMRYSVAAWGLQ
jgi:DNA-binding CsgD family transcriptional regulator